MDDKEELTLAKVQAMLDTNIRYSEDCLMHMLNQGGAPRDIAMVGLMIAVRAVEMGMPKCTPKDKQDKLTEGLQFATTFITADLKG